MGKRQIMEILRMLRAGEVDDEKAAAMISAEEGGRISEFACWDRTRQERTAIPEVILASHKDVEEICAIMEEMVAGEGVVLATRVSPEKAEEVRERLPQITYHRKARMLSANEEKVKGGVGRGTIVIVTAGASDVAVAEEAFWTAKLLGHKVERHYDVGVAGIHRLLENIESLRRAAVVVAVAGMEGALPSVIAGLIEAPVLAVPTSVGYGSGAGGVAALLGMLNSCSPGIAVLNIDNGFGAGCMAAAINRRRSP